MAENKIPLASSSIPTPAGIASASVTAPNSSVCWNRFYALASQHVFEASPNVVIGTL